MKPERLTIKANSDHFVEADDRRKLFSKDRISEDEKRARINFLKKLKDDHDLQSVFKAENDDYLLENVFEDWEIFYQLTDNSHLDSYEIFDSGYIKSLFNGKEENGDITAERNLELVINRVRNEGLLIYNIDPKNNNWWSDDLRILNSNENLQELEEIKIDPLFAVFQVRREE